MSGAPVVAVSGSWIWDGEGFVPGNCVPLSDRGFRYGMSVFESLRVTRGVAEFFDAHAASLMAACLEREIASPKNVLEGARELFQKGEKSGFARIYVTAGDGLPSDPAEQPRVFVFLENREPPAADEAWKITQHRASYVAPFGGLKTGNYWFNCDALAHARRAGFHEALLFNHRAELVSACCANVFLVRDGQLLTPPRASGCRAGVIREWVMSRRKTEERALHHDDVLAAEEIFLTNSWLGVQPIASIRNCALGSQDTAAKLVAELVGQRGEF